MKIAYLITRMDEYGGAQVHVRDLSVWMKAQGYDVTVIAGTLGKVSDELVEQGIDCIAIPALGRSIHLVKDIKALWQLRCALKIVKPDIVSCHSSKAGLIGRIAARIQKICVVFTAHGWAFTTGVSAKKRWLYKRVEAIGAWFGDHIITVSDFDRDLALKANIDKPQHITTIHNGMPFLPEERKCHNKVPQLVMVARFCEQKDHQTVLEALSHIQDKQWHMHFIGKGGDVAYKKQAQDLSITNRITFHGERYDVPDFLTQQDIFILASHWEGFPRSIIEAMRAGMPVIATNTAGNAEAVIDDKTGFIVPERDPIALADALIELLNDPEKCLNMGRAGRKRYEDYFTFDVMAQKTLKIYQTETETRP